MIENLVLVIKGKTYTIDANITVGQYRTIEAMKQNLSLNTYGGMLRSMTTAGDEALDMIDIESYLTILCPKLVEDLKCESFSDLGFIDYNIVKKEYKSKFISWWKKLESILRPEPVKVKIDEETKQD